jgi:hypothetical protein
MEPLTTPIGGVSRIKISGKLSIVKWLFIGATIQLISATAINNFGNPGMYILFFYSSTFFGYGLYILNKNIKEKGADYLQYRRFI